MTRPRGAANRLRVKPTHLMQYDLLRSAMVRHFLSSSRGHCHGLQ
jgi:hypothetical protein